MTKQLMETMDNVLLKLEDVVKECPTEKVKTIAITYSMLLAKLDTKDSDFKDGELTNALVNHKERTNSIISHMDSFSIQDMVNEDKYVELNYLLTTIDKLKSITSKITRVLQEIYLKYNKKVFIISTSAKALEKLNELIEENQEEVWFSDSSHLRTEMKTNKYNYIAYNYVSDGIRGTRMDVVYIDSSMSDEDINFAKSFVKKDTGRFEMF